jgi:uncharacterized protein
MNDIVLQESISQLVRASPDGLHFYWHGGEPLLAGLSFYEKALMVQERTAQQNCKIKNSIQTNGTLLNQEYIDFFKDHDFGIGISLDGPEEIHDKQRFFPSGNGSFSSVMKAVELLKKNDIKVSCLSVITKNSFNRAKDIFDFFYKNELFFFEVSPYFERDELFHSKLDSDLAITPLEFSHFAIELFDIFIDVDDPRVSIRFFANTLSSLLGGRCSLCSMVNQNSCGSIPTINWNGDFYFCDNYEGNDMFYLGNLINSDIGTMIENQTWKKIKEDIKKYQTELSCPNCDIAKVCGGGCPRYWYWMEGRLSLCISHRKIVQHIESKVTQIVNRVIS